MSDSHHTPEAASASLRHVRAKGEPRFPDGPKADPAGSHFERRIRSFQPRRSRVTAGQADALQRLWPLWGLDIDGRRVVDLAELFGNARPVVLEIGFGMGETTARMAAADPDTNILAADVHTPARATCSASRSARSCPTSGWPTATRSSCCARCSPRLPRRAARLLPRPVAEEAAPQARLIQPEFLTLAATRLAPGAVVHCATDWEPYAEQMLDVLTAHPDFENTVPGGGFAPRPEHRPLTRFEGQGLDKGHVVNDLLFRRVQHKEPPPNG